MNAIEIMIMEHTYIKRMLQVGRKYCLKVLNNEEVNYEDFYKIIDFVRNYADKHHHGKEETMLFNRMIDEIGGAAEKLVKFGMLVEHDLGRLFMQNLEAALKKVEAGDKDARVDVIANLIGYTDLLNRHIDKEDNIAYKFAARELSKDTLDKINEEAKAFEKEQEDKNIQPKYIKLLEELEEKVK